MFKQALVVSVLLASFAVSACPKMIADNPQDLTVITDYTTRLEQVGDDGVFNKTIHKCFEANIEVLSWDQTDFLISKLRSNVYGGRKSKVKIQKDMAETYLKKHFDVTFADVALEISAKMEFLSESNQMIQKYFKKALDRNMIDHFQLMMVLKGIYNTSYETERFSQVKTKDRIARAYFKAKVMSISVPEMIELSLVGFRYNEEANEYLEKFFKAHVKNLTWDETMVIINALHNTNFATDKHGKEKTKERMTLLWNEVHN
ncbi:MAG: hypothetical protein ACOYL6_07515 [Bacteriovoracaceae bacterium]